MGKKSGFFDLFEAGSPREVPQIQIQATVRFLRYLLVRFYLQNIALTQGKDGLTLFQYNEENEIRFQGNTSEVFDVTGAGDTVISVLSVLLSINYPLIDACEIANKAGGIIVQKFGTTSITFEDIF